MSLTGQIFDMGTFSGGPREEANPLNYHGTAVINGVRQYALRGPFFDVFYVLSNYYRFDINMTQGVPLPEFKALMCVCI